MTDLVVRRLLVDMEAPIARHWCGGDAFRTALFNALSMSFPVGEQFFIDSVRNGFKALPAGQQERYRAEVQAFVGQEATHRRLHALYNGHLEKLGLVNDWAPRAPRAPEAAGRLDPRHALAITAANEHFTAIMADWMLRNAGPAGQRRPAADDPVAVAQRRGVRAQEHGLRSVPGAGRQPRVAHHLVPPRHHDLPGRHPAPDGEQPAARRHAVEVEHLEKRRLLPVRQARPGPPDLQALARVPAPRLPSQPAGQQPVAALAGRAQRPVHAGWRAGA